MKVFLLAAIVFGAVAPVRAQVAPEAISPRKLDLGISGTLTYSAFYSQMADLYNGTSGQMAYLSGNFGYSTTSQSHPTSILFGAGDGWGVSGTGVDSGLYENLSLSQGFAGKRLSLQLADAVGYFRGTPVTGFTGQPGTGQSISQPSGSVTETVFAVNTNMVSNSSTANASYKLTARTALSGGGGYYLFLFPNGGGLDTKTATVHGSLNHVVDPRDSLFGQYAFFQFTYSGTGFTVDTHSTSGGWQRTWSRHITTSVSAGPQWTVIEANTPEPVSTNLAINALLAGAYKAGNVNLNYSRGIEGGGGYFYGAEMDDFTGSFARQFGHRVGSQFTMEFAGGYMRTSALKSLSSVNIPGVGSVQQGSFNSWYGSTQETRHLGRYLSVYANYTATDQTASSNVPASSNLLTSLWQVVSFGVGFTPQPIHLRH